MKKLLLFFVLLFALNTFAQSCDADKNICIKEGEKYTIDQILLWDTKILWLDCSYESFQIDEEGSFKILHSCLTTATTKDETVFLIQRQTSSVFTIGFDEILFCIPFLCVDELAKWYQLFLDANENIKEGIKGTIEEFKVDYTNDETKDNFGDLLTESFVFDKDELNK